MEIIKSVKVWKANGQIAGVDVKYFVGGKNRFYGKKETLPMNITRFILEARHCRTEYFGSGESEDTYTF